MVVIAAHTAHCEVAHITKRVAAHTRDIAQASCATQYTNLLLSMSRKMVTDKFNVLFNTESKPRFIG